MDYWEEWVDVGEVETDQVILSRYIGQVDALVDLFEGQTLAFRLDSRHVEFPVCEQLPTERHRTLARESRLTKCRFP